ncbi:hypothetical protein QAD02_012796 [Eretmocerus hayati]|uniref:Uncharacterized protein n=1 Tax=Eretmocerus hayati TaxID=131215 RepID=A0ACC2P118_9HYME|nr:hypothetical protein QAD02_012796 [Eretmocerus hayati]
MCNPLPSSLPNTSGNSCIHLADLFYRSTTLNYFGNSHRQLPRLKVFGKKLPNLPSCYNMVLARNTISPPIHAPKRMLPSMNMNSQISNDDSSGTDHDHRYICNVGGTSYALGIEPIDSPDTKDSEMNTFLEGSSVVTSSVVNNMSHMAFDIEPQHRTLTCERIMSDSGGTLEESNLNYLHSQAIVECSHWFSPNPHDLDAQSGQHKPLIPDLDQEIDYTNTQNVTQNHRIPVYDSMQNFLTVDDERQWARSEASVMYEADVHDQNQNLHLMNLNPINSNYPDDTPDEVTQYSSHIVERVKEPFFNLNSQEDALVHRDSLYCPELVHHDASTSSNHIWIDATSEQFSNDNNLGTAHFPISVNLTEPTESLKPFSEEDRAEMARPRDQDDFGELQQYDKVNPQTFTTLGDSSRGNYVDSPDQNGEPSDENSKESDVMEYQWWNQEYHYSNECQIGKDHPKDGDQDIECKLGEAITFCSIPSHEPRDLRDSKPLPQEWSEHPCPTALQGLENSCWDQSINHPLREPDITDDHRPVGEDAHDTTVDSPMGVCDQGFFRFAMEAGHNLLQLTPLEATHSNDRNRMNPIIVTSRGNMRGIAVIATSTDAFDDGNTETESSSPVEEGIHVPDKRKHSLHEPRGGDFVLHCNSENEHDIREVHPSVTSERPKLVRKGSHVSETSLEKFNFKEEPSVIEDTLEVIEDFSKQSFAETDSNSSRDLKSHEFDQNLVTPQPISRAESHQRGHFNNEDSIDETRIILGGSNNASYRMSDGTLERYAHEYDSTFFIPRESNHTRREH